MEASKEEKISDMFVKVELKLNSIIQLCDGADKAFQSSKWSKEKELTLRKFDELVKTAEGNDEDAKETLLQHLRACLLRIRFAHKLAQMGVFILFDGPGHLLPVLENADRKERMYQKH